MVFPKIVVLISGNGSNLQALIDATLVHQTLAATIVLVISNRSIAYGLQRAKNHSIPTRTLTLRSFTDEGKSRLDYDFALASLVQETAPSAIVLAGWMHILSADFLSHFPNQIINLHPALPGQFDGARAIERAFDAFKRGEICHTGVMVHKVIPEVDRGDVIIHQEVEITKADTLESLQHRLHQVEHSLIVEGTRLFLKTLSCIPIDNKK